MRRHLHGACTEGCNSQPREICCPVHVTCCVRLDASRANVVGKIMLSTVIVHTKVHETKAFGMRLRHHLPNLC